MEVLCRKCGSIKEENSVCCGTKEYRIGVVATQKTIFVCPRNHESKQAGKCSECSGTAAALTCSQMTKPEFFCDSCGANAPVLEQVNYQCNEINADTKEVCKSTVFRMGNVLKRAPSEFPTNTYYDLIDLTVEDLLFLDKHSAW
jgi:hypothetical protein